MIACSIKSVVQAKREPCTPDRTIRTTASINLSHLRASITPEIALTIRLQHHIRTIDDKCPHDFNSTARAHTDLLARPCLGIRRLPHRTDVVPVPAAAIKITSRHLEVSMRSRHDRPHTCRRSSQAADQAPPAQIHHRSQHQGRQGVQRLNFRSSEIVARDLLHLAVSPHQVNSHSQRKRRNLTHQIRRSATSARPTRRDQALPARLLADRPSHLSRLSRAIRRPIWRSQILLVESRT